MAAKAGTETRKKTSSQRQKEEEKRERSEKLNAQKDSLQSRLAAVEALRSGFEMPLLEGREVEHTQYGPGTVISQQGAVITVRYGETVKKQKLPYVVSGGFLLLRDDQLETQMVHMEELDRQKDSLEKEIHYIESLLSDLERA
jgi:ATP-dependent 26S proteasome regulatory subunit